jgi:hypothetical protein
METYQIVWSIVGLIILGIGLILAIILDNKDKSFKINIHSIINDIYKEFGL